MTDNTGLGRRLKELLEKKGVAQREFAEMCGVTEAAMSRYIREGRKPRATILIKMAQVLNVTPDYLLGVEPEPVPDPKPCPFCGAPAFIWQWNGGARVDCSKWSSDAPAVNVHFVGIGAKTRDEAVKIWNTRSEKDA